MSQHDFTIDNQGFPAFRSDLNSALQALISNSAGTSAPSTTFAYQLWYDSTNNILKMRNADNDAWISLYEFDQVTDSADIPSVNLPEATTSQAGILESATDTEAKALSATDKIITPSNVDAVFAEPPEIGSTTPAAGNFTTVSASSTYNGLNVGLSHSEGTAINIFSSKYSATMSDDGGYDTTITKSSHEFGVWLLTHHQIGGGTNFGMEIVSITDDENLKVTDLTGSAIIANNTPNFSSFPTFFTDGKLSVTRSGSSLFKISFVNRLGYHQAHVKLLQII